MPGKGRGRDPICCSMAISISNLIDDTGAMTSCMMTVYILELKTKVRTDIIGSCPFVSGSTNSISVLILYRRDLDIM